MSTTSLTTINKVFRKTLHFLLETNMVLSLRHSDVKNVTDVKELVIQNRAIVG